MAPLRTVMVGDIDVAFNDRLADDGRRGVPLVFMHGAIQTRRIWESQAAFLAGSRRLVAADLRGHGDTVLGSSRMTMEQLARDTLSLLDALQIEKAAICGVSLGGMIALEVAERAPDRISSVILANTPTSLTSRRWLNRLVDRIDPQDLLLVALRLLGRERAARFGLALASKAVDPRWVGATARQYFIESFVSMDPKAIVATYRAVVEACPVRPESIRCPVLLIKGDADAPSINSQMDMLGSELRNVRLKSLHAGHVASLDTPAAFNRLLASFLDQHDPA